jgi:hypothetical protein
MSDFQPYKIAWNGVEHIIPRDGLMMAGAAVEKVITLSDLARQLQTADYKIIQIAMAYGALLRHLGVNVTDLEVRDGMFQGKKLNQANVIASLFGLLQLFLPPNSVNELASGKPRPTNRAERRKAKAVRS